MANKFKVYDFASSSPHPDVFDKKTLIIITKVNSDNTYDIQYCSDLQNTYPEFLADALYPVSVDVGNAKLLELKTKKFAYINDLLFECPIAYPDMYEVKQTIGKVSIMFNCLNKKRVIIESNRLDYIEKGALDNLKHDYDPITETRVPIGWLEKLTINTFHETKPATIATGAILIPLYP